MPGGAWHWLCQLRLPGYRVLVQVQYRCILRSLSMARLHSYLHQALLVLARSPRWRLHCSYDGLESFRMIRELIHVSAYSSAYSKLCLFIYLSFWETCYLNRVLIGL